MSYAQPQPPLQPLIVLVLVTAAFATCSQIRDVGPLGPPVKKKKQSVVIEVPVPTEECLLKCDATCDECAQRADGVANAIFLCEIDRDGCYSVCVARKVKP